MNANESNVQQAANTSVGPGGDTGPTESNQIPNSFVSLQITSHQIRQGLSQVQDELVRHKPSLRFCRSRPESFHLTLLVMHLDGAADFQKVRDALAEAVVEISTIPITNLALDFEGIGVFDNKQVCFSMVKPNEHLKKLEKIQGIVRSAFCKNSVPVIEDFGPSWTPHLTISKPTKFCKDREAEIERKYFEEMENNFFGTEFVEAIQVRSMKNRREMGYFDAFSVNLFN